MVSELEVFLCVSFSFSFDVVGTLKLYSFYCLASLIIIALYTLKYVVAIGSAK